jgi:hypothetical protein
MITEYIDSIKDHERYKQEMVVFNSRLRTEALRSPTKAALAYAAFNQYLPGHHVKEATFSAPPPMAVQGYAYGSMDFDGYAMPSSMYHYASYMAAVSNHGAMTGAGFPVGLVTQQAAWHQPYATEIQTVPGYHMGHL